MSGAADDGPETSRQVKKRRRRSFETEELQRLLNEGVPQREIAARLGVSQGAIQRRIRSDELSQPYWGGRPGGRAGRSFSSEDLLALLNSGLSQRDAAAKLGVSRSAVARRIHTDGLAAKVQAPTPPVVPKPPRPPAKPRPKPEDPPPQRRLVARPPDLPPEPEPPARRREDAAFLARLIRTGGRYADLREFARGEGLTYTQALQCWHGLRTAPQARRA